jgi:hypothetical protein
MEDWVPFEEGKYAVTRAVLTSAAHHAVRLAEPVLEIYTGRLGKRQLRGYALVQNTALVDLHEDGDEIDLLLDLGADFRFLLENPVLQGGKVFSPNVRSVIHFYPREPWRSLSIADFEARIEALSYISS